LVDLDCPSIVGCLSLFGWLKWLSVCGWLTMVACLSMAGWNGCLSIVVCLWLVEVTIQFFFPVVSLYAPKGQLQVLPSEIIS
jgi:hypothetical protein